MKEEDRTKGLGGFLQFCRLMPTPFFLFFPSFSPASLAPHQHLKNHSHSCCVSAHAGRNFRGSAPDRLDNSKASLCVGTGGTAEFPRPPGEGEGRGREEAEVLEPVACGGEGSERDERGTYISRGTMGVLLAGCEKTRWGYNALWHMKALGTFPESHSALRSLVNILKCKENNPFRFLVF